MIRFDPIHAFADNYIWAMHDGRVAWVIDPGDGDPVQRWLADRGVTLAGILLTHHHGDHVGGVPMLTRGRAIPVIGPAHEDIAAITQRVQESDEVALPQWDVRFKVLDVPGHTGGHIAYFGLVEGAPTLFCGDTLFAAGCGRLFEGTPQQMWASLGKLAALPAHTKAYCAHEYTLANLAFAKAAEPGNAAVDARRTHCEALRRQDLPTIPFTIAEELATNPFIRAGAVERFAQLREWKNSFRA